MGWFTKKKKQEEIPVVQHEDSVDTYAQEAQISEPEPVVEEAVSESAPIVEGFFARLKAGLSKTRNSISESFNNLFKASELDDDFYDELEETLVMSDMGFETTERIIDDLKERVKSEHIKEVEACKNLVINIIRDQMSVDETAYDFENKKTVVFVIGVNGVGKTTSIGKLAAQYKAQGKKVMMAAADTFRAAAIDQLKTWSDRAGVEIIAQNEGADPSAVVYDAVAAAKSRNTDILLIDTAGRLHNKKNLMDELAKMRRIISKEYPEANVESLIVLDGTTGQNALEQARQFSSVTEINGIIITKLDGTAKGGIAIAIQAELNVPVKYIGIGEKIEDLQKFDPNSYVTALFSDFDMRSDIEIIVDEEIEEMPKDDDLFDM
ncbi:MAG: signal recognition particle-docking protein FtsY [Wujia sp.]